jgi:hypothetical protein
LIQQFRHEENRNPVVEPVRTGSPAMKTVGWSQKQVFGQKGILVSFHVEFYFSPKYVDDFTLLVAVGTKVNSRSFVAFVMPYFYMAGTKNAVIYVHGSHCNTGRRFFPMSFVDMGMSLSSCWSFQFHKGAV